MRELIPLVDMKNKEYILYKKTKVPETIYMGLWKQWTPFIAESMQA